MIRGNSEIWDLVGYDPVCTNVRTMTDVLRSSGYPEQVATLAFSLWRMVRDETYDRLEKPHDVRALQEAEL